ncbi:MAG: hypothetical protein LBV51_04085, partial [Acholeplasmatales bacterium]|nr:hypothetical protein [Acholeplasmatales bacterium]
DNLYFKYDNYNINTSLVGNYQIANIILAINIIKELDSNISSALIENAIKDTLWAGRFEKVDPKKHIYIDGAHNIGGIKSLIETIKLLNYRNLYILFSALEDKNPTILIEELLKITPNIILTTFSDARIYDPTNIILNYNLDFIPSPLMAYNMVKNNMEDGDLFVITGSIHFIGYMKKDIIK